MKKKNTNSKQGFTIIEVVLVLAIAGLIFLMVFIALPALQRNQRDTQRRQDMSRAITAIQNYQTNNSGKIPSFDATFITNYLKTGGDSFADPSGDDYKFYKSTDTSATNVGLGTCTKKDDGTCSVQALSDFKSGVIIALKNATCDSESAIYVTGERRVALLMKLEGAGVLCMSN